MINRLANELYEFLVESNNYSCLKRMITLNYLHTYRVAFLCVHKEINKI